MNPKFIYNNSVGLVFLGLVFWGSTTLEAQNRVPVAVVKEAALQAKDGQMTANMQLDLSGMDVKSNRAVLISPFIVNGADSIALPEVGIYGRRRYYYYVRNNQSILTDSKGVSYRTGEMPDALPYTATTYYHEWMNGAQLKLYYQLYGCCSDILDENQQLLAQWDQPEPFIPALVYLRPEAETSKTRELSGSAYIDFYVNKTFIAPEYHNNTAELSKIQQTIDGVRSDKDVTIQELHIKGYASPESPYSHNAKLAKGRTEALKEYVQKLNQFADGVITTSYEPENWEGLIRAVEGDETLKNREAILELITSDREPDNKEWTLKRDFPTEYRYLLKEVYPYLRRSDYRIGYTIRTYTDVEEIKRVLKTRPQNLSLNEFFLAAQSMEEGSDEYNEVFETAVRMYPDSEVANLNAANVALKKADLDTAERYLQKAGTSAHAAYARGALAFLKEDYSTARVNMQQALTEGIREAQQVLEEIAKLK